MAAFERVSDLTIRPYGRHSIIDYRSARLSPGAITFHPPDSNDPEQNNYNPRDHRSPTNPISVWMAYFNLIKTSCAAGVLAFPVAISQTGIVFGPILGVFTGILVIHTHLLLLKCLNEISRRFKVPHISYRYGFRIALLHGPEFMHNIGRNGHTIIAIFMLMSQIGICCVFIDLTSDSLRDIMDWQSSRPAICCLLLPYLLLEYFMTSLKIVSYISVLGNILNLVGFLLIIYLSLLDPLAELDPVKIKAVPLSFAFGIFLFNSSAVGVILTLDRALPNPEVLVKRCGVIHLGMGVPTAIGILFGALVYWSFGVLEENCLRTLPYDDNVTMVVFGLYLISVAFTYPIQCYPAIQILIEVYKYRNLQLEPSEDTIKLFRKLARPLFVLLTFTISYLIPLQTPFVAFVGCLCTTMLSLTFPALMELCLMYPGPYGKWYIYLIKDGLIVLLGVISWLVGVVFTAYIIYIKILLLPAINDPEYF